MMTPIASVIVSLLIVAYIFYKRRDGLRSVAQWKKEYPEYKLAAVAQRLGLAIVEGDPDYNLFIGYLDVSLRRSDEAEIHARLEGQPGGRHTEFVYCYRQNEFSATLSVAVDGPFPGFEIVLREAGFGMCIEPALGFPMQSFGDPGLDRHLALYSEDVHLGGRLAKSVASLLAEGYVHIQGRRGCIEVPMNMAGVSMTLAHVELFHLALVGMAEALDGRRANLPAPGHPMGGANAVALRAKIAQAEAAEGAIAGRANTLDMALNFYRQRKVEFGVFFGVMILFPIVFSTRTPVQAITGVITTVCPIAGAFLGWWWVTRRASNAALPEPVRVVPAAPARCVSCNGERSLGDSASTPCVYCGAVQAAPEPPTDEARAYAERAAEVSRRASRTYGLMNPIYFGCALVGTAVGYGLSAVLTFLVRTLARAV